MIISDLNYFEVAAEAGSVLGGTQENHPKKDKKVVKKYVKQTATITQSADAIVDIKKVMIKAGDDVKVEINATGGNNTAKVYQSA